MLNFRGHRKSLFDFNMLKTDMSFWPQTSNTGRKEAGKPAPGEICKFSGHLMVKRFG
jgi:hypothetical protein